jgi:enoyl-CoA hydratase/carnithine racemase
MSLAESATGLAEPLIRREDEGGVVLLTLDRPASRNSLSEAMMAELASALEAIGADHAVRAVVLAGRGPVFCAGHDLKEITARRSDADRGRSYFVDVLARCSAIMGAILRLPQPVIAAVEGPATAAGCQLVATCDLAVASTTARFCTPGVNIGFFCSTPMVALSRNLSRKHAMAMLLTGEWVEAEEALRMGLVNRVVPAGRAVEEAKALAALIAGKSATSVRIGKEAFYRQLEMGVEPAYRYAAEVMVENMLARDAEEGVAALLAKRPPRWDLD